MFPDIENISMTHLLYKLLQKLTSRRTVPQTFYFYVYPTYFLYCALIRCQKFILNPNIVINKDALKEAFGTFNEFVLFLGGFNVIY